MGQSKVGQTYGTAFRLGHVGDKDTLLETKGEPTITNVHTGNITQRTSIVCNTSQRTSYTQMHCNNNHWAISSDKIAMPKYSLVDDVHKLVYCNIPKAASISFRTYLGRLLTANKTFEIKTRVDLNNAGIYFKETHIRQIIELNEADFDDVMRLYKRLIIVRHPFDRLRSAYDDKLSKPNVLNVDTLDETKVQIINSFLREKQILPDNSTFDPAKDILTFSQFVELVANYYHVGFQNAHWRPMTESCNLCNVSYDFILRVETLDSDMEKVYSYFKTVSAFNETQIISHENMTKQKQSTLTQKLSKMKTRYLEIDENIINNLLNLYQIDFDVFGYGWNMTEGGTCQLVGQQDEICC